MSLLLEDCLREVEERIDDEDDSLSPCPSFVTADPEERSQSPLLSGEEETGFFDLMNATAASEFGSAAGTATPPSPPLEETSPSRSSTPDPNLVTPERAPSGSVRTMRDPSTAPLVTTPSPDRMISSSTTRLDDLLDGESSDLSKDVDGEDLVRDDRMSTVSPVPPPSILPDRPDPLEPRHGFLGFTQDFQKLLAPGQKAALERTFAFRVFGERLVTIVVPLNSELERLPVQWTSPHGWKYELLMTKVQRKAQGYGFQFSKEVTAIYVLTEAPGIPTINPVQELNKIAAFGLLQPEKVSARLELLFSPARKASAKSLVEDGHSLQFRLSASDFEQIHEKANEGCGFIPREYIHRFLGTQSVGKRTFQLQVRVFSPKMGVDKGTLFEKPGISKIQLPPSQKKVGPSLTSSEDWAHLVITSVFPSSTNVYMGRILAGEKPPRSFRPNQLSGMIKKLLRSLAVPDEIVEEYAENSSRPSRDTLQHAHLVGAADSTNAIPAGHVFVTGSHDVGVSEVFVTRYPCTGREDGLVLPLVTSKPDGMSESEWSCLQSHSFGTIIFGNPADGENPLPSLVSNGDLDGDLYFTCWNERILSSVRRDGPFSLRRDDDRVFREQEWNDNWFSDAQQRMSDVQAIGKLHALIGKLHTLWNKSSGTEAAAFGRAYKEAIDIGKHGGKVHLPEELWDKIPERLHSVLMGPDSLTGSAGQSAVVASHAEHRRPTRQPSLDVACSSLSSTGPTRHAVTSTTTSAGLPTASTNSTDDFAPNESILIVGGIHANKRGVVVRRTEARVCVRIDGIEKERFLAPKNIRRADGTEVRA